MYSYCPVTPKAGWETTRAMMNTFEEISCVLLFSLHSAFLTTPTSVGGFDNIEALHSRLSSDFLFIFFYQNKEWTSVERRKVIYDMLAVMRVLAQTSHWFTSEVTLWKAFLPALILLLGMSKTLNRIIRRDGLTVILESVFHLKMIFTKGSAKHSNCDLNSKL